MKLVPTFQHDCDSCRFIASVSLFGRIADIWRSCSSMTDGYIVRFGNEPENYHTTYERIDLPLSERYRCGYNGNPGGLILSVDQTLCRTIETLVNEVNKK